MKRLIGKAKKVIMAAALIVSLIPATVIGNTETVSASTDMTLQQMYDSPAYRALEYLGYDSSSILRSKGWTFNPNYVGSKLKASSYWNSCRPQYKGKTLDYKEFTGSASQVIDPADRDTVYAKGGFNCSQAAQYYVFGFLVDQLGYSFPGLPNRTAVTVNGSVGGFGSVYRLIRTLDDYISRYPDYCRRVVGKSKRNAAETVEAFNKKLLTGDIVCMWAPDDTYQHVAIYVGKYNGTHYLFHSGVVGRGPELITLDALAGQSLNSGSAADPESYQAMLNDSEADLPEPGSKASGSSQYLYTAYRMTQPDGCGMLIKSIGSGNELCQLAGSDYYSLKGAVYAVYSDYECQDQVLDSAGEPAEFVTDENGKAQLRLPLGSYYVREVSAPLGFSLDDTVYALTITSANTVDNPAVLRVSDDALFDPFTLILTKKNGDGQPVSGAQFTLSYYNADLASADEAMSSQAAFSWVLETDGNGRIRYDEDHLVSGDQLFRDEDGNEVLIDGTYVLEETLVPAHYSKAPVLLIKVRGAEAKIFNAEGTMEIGPLLESGFDLRETSTGYLKLLKQSSDSEFALSHSLASTEYTVYLDSECQTEAGCEKLVIGEDNESNTVELDPGTYYVRESRPADGYQLDETIYPVTVVEKETVTLQCSDDPASGSLKIIKKSSYEDYQLTHPLTGTEFSVFRDAECTRLIAVLTVDEHGVSETYELSIGTYYVRETLAPQDYLLSDEVYPVEISADETLELECLNDPGLAPVEIRKTDSSAGQTLEGAHLQLWDEEGNLIDEWITDSQPHIIWLPVGGKYTLKETEAPEGFLKADDIVFTVSGYQGETVIIEMEDSPKGTVETADPAGVPLYMAMVLVSLNGMSLYVISRRKED
ncbi:MAG: hypothetical protein K6A14_08200 [Erysipelotrichaceae bacterium]|nr:hypothetical protein [Erysipelotrichaceae bacterium]